MKVSGEISSMTEYADFYRRKVGVSQPTASEHLRVLVQARLLISKKIKQWTFYRRDEKHLVDLKKLLGKI